MGTFLHSGIVKEKVFVVDLACCGPLLLWSPHAREDREQQAPWEEIRQNKHPRTSSLVTSGRHFLRLAPWCDGTTATAPVGRPVS